MVMSLNLANIPFYSARHYGTQPAIRFGQNILSYQELTEQISAIAFALQQHGLKKGDKVALLLPNVPQFSVCYYAILAAAGVVVPLNVLFTADEIHYHLKDSESIAIIAWEAFLNQALEASKDTNCHYVIACRTPNSEEPLPNNVLDYSQLMQTSLADRLSRQLDVSPTSPDDSAVILYTSGTTGRPKGAELTHFNLYDNARWVAERLMRTENDKLFLFGPDHVALAALPLFHSFGQTVIQNAFLMHGASISLLPRFTPKDTAETILNHKVSFFAGVPTMYIALLNDEHVTEENLASLKYAISGGAPLPVEVLEKFKQRFGISILEGYGLSETSPVACFNNLMAPQKPGTVGPPIDLCEVKIVDKLGKELVQGELGEIVIRGSNIMKQYYKQKKATNEALRNGWFYTGDLGRIDEDGFVSIVDRKKDMIIHGGMNVYPREVEEIIYQHESIAEVAVIGLPDPLHGEAVVAVVALKPKHKLYKHELAHHCRKHLASFKVPRRTIIMKSLPKGPTGKILKREIRTQIQHSENVIELNEI